MEEKGQYKRGCVPEEDEKKMGSLWENAEQRDEKD